MRTYLIKGLSRKGIEVFAFSDAGAAARADESRFADHPTVFGAGEDDFASKLSGPAIVGLHNALIDEGAKPVERFATKGDGAKRLFALLTEKFSTIPVEPESKSVAGADAAATTNENEEDDMATKGKKTTKAAKPKKAPGEKKAKGAPALVREETYKGRILKYGVEGTKSLAQLVVLSKLADNGRNSKSRVKFRAKKVAALVGGTFSIDEKEIVTIKLPAGKTLDKIFGRA